MADEKPTKGGHGVPIDVVVLKAERERKGWSQKRLANEVGCDPRLIERIETRGTAALKSLLELSQALNIDPLILRRPVNAIIGGKDVLSEKVSRFDGMLSECATKLKLLDFLAENPTLLFNSLGYKNKPAAVALQRMGEFTVDIALCEILPTSKSYDWHLLFFEDSFKCAFNESGMPTPELERSVKQVRDITQWINHNLAVARACFVDIRGNCRKTIVIGRRTQFENEDRKLLLTNYLDRNFDINVRTYDWFLGESS